MVSWDEETYEELDDGARLARAVVTQKFGSAIEGDGSVHWSMAYRADGTAHFVGLQRVHGIIEDRKDAVILETIGDFETPIEAAVRVTGCVGDRRDPTSRRRPLRRIRS